MERHRGMLEKYEKMFDKIRWKLSWNILNGYDNYSDKYSKNKVNADDDLSSEKTFGLCRYYPKYTVRRMFVSIIKMIDKKNINIFFLFQYVRLEYSTISKSSIKKVKEYYNKNKEKNNIVKKLNNKREHMKEIAIERIKGKRKANIEKLL